MSKIIAVYAALVTIALTVAIFNNHQPVNVVVDEPHKQWHDVLCIEDNGNAQMHTIPVPKFFSFSPKFTADYYDAAGEEYCESIRDKAVYVIDVGE